MMKRRKKIPRCEKKGNALEEVLDGARNRKLVKQVASFGRHLHTRTEGRGFTFLPEPGLYTRLDVLQQLMYFIKRDDTTSSIRFRAHPPIPPKQIRSTVPTK